MSEESADENLVIKFLEAISDITSQLGDILLIAQGQDEVVQARELLQDKEHMSSIDDMGHLRLLVTAGKASESVLTSKTPWSDVYVETNLEHVRKHSGQNSQAYKNFCPAYEHRDPEMQAFLTRDRLTRYFELAQGTPIFGPAATTMEQQTSALAELFTCDREDTQRLLAKQKRVDPNSLTGVMTEETRKLYYEVSSARLEELCGNGTFNSSVLERRVKIHTAVTRNVQHLAEHLSPLKFFTDKGKLLKFANMNANELDSHYDAWILEKEGRKVDRSPFHLETEISSMLQNDCQSDVEGSEMTQPGSEHYQATVESDDDESEFEMI